MHNTISLQAAVHLEHMPWARTKKNTQSSAPEDGRDHRPKHVELIGIINKPLLLHLVGVYIIYGSDAQSNKYRICDCVEGSPPLSETNTMIFQTQFCRDCFKWARRLL